MRGFTATWARIRVLCAPLILALSLAAAPAIEAVKHGPEALATEAEHRAHHAAHGHVHDMPASDHHGSSDHDHVMAIMLSAPEAAFYPTPERTLRSTPVVDAGTIRDGPLRPPRLSVI
jgi:hypothetical protein